MGSDNKFFILTILAAFSPLAGMVAGWPGFAIMGCVMLAVIFKGDRNHD